MKDNLSQAISYSESLIVHSCRAKQLRSEAVHLLSKDLNRRQLRDLESLLNRAFYPLAGFLGRDDYESVLKEMRLTDGSVWPVPICLDVNEEFAASLQPGQCIGLNDQEGFLLAILTISDIWKADKKAEAKAVYGTEDPEQHPGVQALFTEVKDWYIGGTVEGVTLPIHYDFCDLRLTPAESNRRFIQYGWRRVVGFHTREYLHCAHREMVLAAARETGGSLFLHPLVGLDHPGNMEHYTHVHCYQEFVQHFPRNMIQLGIIPLAERYTGPREALWHALIRKNYGCTHFIVAADHGDPFAGTNADLFYPQGEAQQLVASLAEETGIEMVPERAMGYAEEQGKYVYLADIPDEKVRHINSKELKRRLEQDENVPG
ncbi:MAG: adenylyltransferase, partial [Candidatus Electrothrix sp. AR5]|nr:adenylyltransferase [Candidatus Electrothrix sp. AR5]